jgi:ankyrin repeat protein
VDGHEECCRLLLNAGADVKFVSRSMNPLEYAEDNERDDLIPILREAMEQ